MTGVSVSLCVFISPTHGVESGFCTTVKSRRMRWLGHVARMGMGTIYTRVRGENSSSSWKAWKQTEYVNGS